jgi:hypothetical protein
MLPSPHLHIASPSGRDEQAAHLVAADVQFKAMLAVFTHEVHGIAHYFPLPRVNAGLNEIPQTIGILDAVTPNLFRTNGAIRRNALNDKTYAHNTRVAQADSLGIAHPDAMIRAKFGR